MALWTQNGSSDQEKCGKVHRYRIGMVGIDEGAFYFPDLIKD
jgi:hypothetical protein